ncbi:6-phospho-3-hexuloisomerase [Silvibacterium dinghuense]|nr:6-phospho-3-hexuloisomerase [Silvibacterium dinghuense]GGG95686.1 3-hexulose-6-phosphate isomerase [Silvibacterium dinghuense]
MTVAELALEPRTLILEELQRCMDAVAETELLEAQRAILHAPRIFTAGAGRSGLALKMVAMRLMHLGLTVHVAGEVTTPAISAGDLLILASGSGTTSSVVHAAQVAKHAGAKLLVFTTAPESPLGLLADFRIIIPAAAKQEHDGVLSRQYAGALFEQSVLLLADVLFHQMWREHGESAASLWTRHANLE